MVGWVLAALWEQGRSSARSEGSCTRSSAFSKLQQHPGCALPSLRGWAPHHCNSGDGTPSAEGQFSHTV